MGRKIRKRTTRLDRMRSLQFRLTEVMECCAVYDGVDMSPAPASLSAGKNHYYDRFVLGIGSLVLLSLEKEC